MLTGPVCAIIDQAAVMAAPAEACGLIIDGPEAWVGRNLAGLGRFELGPELFFRARREGRRILAIWHSHVGAPATPSAADRRLARDWPGVALVIVRVDGDRVTDRQVHLL